MLANEWRASSAASRCSARTPTPRQLFVKLQLQRVTPRGCQRTYEVFVEPGAAARAATPRDALRRSAATPDISGSYHPSRASTSCSYRGSARRGGFCDNEMPPEVRPSPRRASSERSSPVGPRALAAGGSARSAAAANLPNSQVAQAVVAEPPALAAQAADDDDATGSSDFLWDQVIGTLEDDGFAPRTCTLMGHTPSNRLRGVRRQGTRTGSSSMKSSRFGTEEESSTYVEFSRGGLTVVQEPSQELRTRNQIQGIGQLMLKSMMTSYDREVWNACDVAHPDQQREQERLAIEAAKALAAAKAAEKIRGLARFGFTNEQRTQTIPYRADQEEDSEVLREEKVIAWLAKESGWSVLDVEEVRDVFLRHATDGAINLHGRAFRALLQELYTVSSEDEVRSFIRDIRLVKSEVRFIEFYLALAHWLQNQLKRKSKSMSPAITLTSAVAKFKRRLAFKAQAMKGAQENVRDAIDPAEAGLQLPRAESDSCRSIDAKTCHAGGATFASSGSADAAASNRASGQLAVELDVLDKALASSGPSRTATPKGGSPASSEAEEATKEMPAPRLTGDSADNSSEESSMSASESEEEEAMQEEAYQIP